MIPCRAPLTVEPRGVVLTVNAFSGFTVTHCRVVVTFTEITGGVAANLRGSKITKNTAARTRTIIIKFGDDDNASGAEEEEREGEEEEEKEEAE